MLWKVLCFVLRILFRSLFLWVHKGVAAMWHTMQLQCVVCTVCTLTLLAAVVLIVFNHKLFELAQQLHGLLAEQTQNQQHWLLHVTVLFKHEADETPLYCFLFEHIFTSRGWLVDGSSTLLVSLTSGSAVWKEIRESRAFKCQHTLEQYVFIEKTSDPS